VEERLMLKISSAQKEELIYLTKNLDPIDTEKENLIITRLADFKSEGKSLDGGKKLFAQNCSPCHQIRQEGGFIGPQLDGVGNWGSKALAEKILDPNRNISEAFRTYTIRTKDGKTMNGLYRREEGEVIVFANISGEEFSVPKKEIAEQKPSKYTIMPDHFGSVLSQDDFNTLLSYLLSVK
jgi:putative heme-binding domain-containing protein